MLAQSTSSVQMGPRADSSDKGDFAKQVTFRHQFVALVSRVFFLQTYIAIRSSMYFSFSLNSSLVQFLKDTQLQFKSYKTNICQLLVPIVFISFAGLVQVIVNGLIPANTVVPGSDSKPLPVGECYTHTRARTYTRTHTHTHTHTQN